MRAFIWMGAACVGCSPRPCGTVIVGGGSVELTIAPPEGESFTLAIPGAPEPSYGGGGTKLIREFSATVLNTLTFRHTATEPPCGAPSSAIYGSAVWSYREEEEEEASVLDTGHVEVSGDLITGWSSLGQQDLSQTSAADGALSVEMSPYITHPLCSAWMSAVTFSLSWAFDPKTAIDTVDLCW